MARREELTDEQWALIEPLIPELPRRDDGRGRPWRGTREVINGVLWILRSGARWQDLPGRVLTSEGPERLIGDKAYDSDPLDAELKERGIELIAPHKSNRKKAPTQDGRPLRRYKRRWKIERLFAWLQNFRRIAMRFDFHDENYLGFVHLGCIRILLRCYL
jgi:transposase